MKKINITIQLHPGNTQKTIPAYDCGNSLAVHRLVEYGNWTLTHIETGLAMQGGFTLRKNAVAFGQEPLVSSMIAWYMAGNQVEIDKHRSALYDIARKHKSQH